MRARAAACPRQSIARDARGVTYLEYLIVTVGVALPVCLALLTVGDLLLRLYHFQQRLIRFPIP